MITFFFLHSFPNKFEPKNNQKRTEITGRIRSVWNSQESERRLSGGRRDRRRADSSSLRANLATDEPPGTAPGFARRILGAVAIAGAGEELGGDGPPAERMGNLFSLLGLYFIYHGLMRPIFEGPKSFRTGIIRVVIESSRAILREQIVFN